MIRLKVFLALFFMGLSNHLNSQLESNDSLYAISPVWIQMIDDEKANYYETIRAYEIYEKNNKLPIRGKDLVKDFTAEELNQLTETQKNTPVYKKHSPEELAKQQRDQEMIHQMRRYQNWKKMHASHVRGDGSIPTIQEILENSKKQIEEQRKLEAK